MDVGGAPVVGNGSGAVLRQIPLDTARLLALP